MTINETDANAFGTYVFQKKCALEWWKHNDEYNDEDADDTSNDKDDTDSASSILTSSSTTTTNTGTSTSNGTVKNLK